MPKLKREMFARPTRFTHRFGDKDDPFQSSEYFDAPYPDGIKSVNQNGKGAFHGKQKGIAVYTEPYSGVDKAKGGKASLSGPRPDVPDAIAETAPASTKMRRTQGPNIKGKKGD
jgi:hypothetical protein